MQLFFISESPISEPHSSCILLKWTCHAKCNRAEIDKCRYDQYKGNGKDHGLCSGRGLGDKMIHQQWHHENAKVQGREIMVKIGDTSHDEEWQIVKEPSNKQNPTREIEIFHFFP